MNVVQDVELLEQIRLIERLEQFDSEMSVSFPITLFVNGAIISGDLITLKKYYECLSENYKELKSDNELDKIIPETFSDFYSQKKNYLEGKENTTHDFIHLKNVKILNQNSMILRDAFLRVKVNSVDGFFLGKAT